MSVLESIDLLARAGDFKLAQGERTVVRFCNELQARKRPVIQAQEVDQLGGVSDRWSRPFIDHGKGPTLWWGDFRLEVHRGYPWLGLHLYISFAGFAELKTWFLSPGPVQFQCQLDQAAILAPEQADMDRFVRRSAGVNRQMAA